MELAFRIGNEWFTFWFFGFRIPLGEEVIPDLALFVGVRRKIMN